MRQAFLFLVILFFLPQQAQAEKLRIFGGYGVEEKFDTLEDLVSSDRYIAILINYKQAFEFQLIPISSDGRGGTHISANYHFITSKTAPIAPFANIGVGFRTSETEKLHLNLDAGLQFGNRRFKIRVFHKSQNRFWGDVQYGTSAYIFALGITIR